MAGFVLVAVVMRPVGGWLSDRFCPIPVLAGVLGVVVLAAAVQGATPALMPVGTVAFLSMAAALGAGAGAVFALVAQRSPASTVGAVTGVVGAAGGLGGFVPPLLMGSIYGRSGSYGLGLVLLSASRARNPRLRCHRGPAPGYGARMTEPSAGSTVAGPDGPGADALLRVGRFLRRVDQVSPDLRAVERTGGREGDVFYRDRWSHDKVVRSTHGVNCTGSCSWKVYVKDGIITWESQQTDYPSVGPDSPEYEPRGCPRGAAFSWYTYSPTRVRFPYVRGVLVEMYREAKARLGDPVLAWADVVGDPDRRRRYQQARGKGGHVRVGWDEAAEIIAAAHVHTIRAYGPDRVVGFSPIPAMSMVSHAVGARFIELLGGVMTSFYDWYADLPVASPQVFGDQTDVPESGDWWNATYLLMWGSNVPVTRTPDAHWMAEARYKGQKVVTISPDYADNTKFADEWLPAQPGTDGALAMAMGHVMLKEFLVDRRTPFFTDYLARYTDMPFLVTLTERDGAYVPGKFLTAADLGDDERGRRVEDRARRRSDRRAGRPQRVARVPAHRVGPGAVEPRPRRAWRRSSPCPADPLGEPPVEVLLPRFDTPDGHGEVLHRGVPARRVGGRLVTTVFDLVLAQYGVARPGLPGRWPTGYDDADEPYTPAWQEPLTSVPADQCARIAREMARNAEASQGRTMIIMGAGVCQWFHGDATYRAILSLLLFTGSMGRNGGGWAHYVGQEKCRPLTGHATMAMALDWVRPPRQMIGTAFWYTHTDQWRYDGYRADALASPLADGHLAGMHTADTIAQSARLGWMPSYPQFDRSPLDLADDARGGRAAARRVRRRPAPRRRPAVGRRGPGRAGELAARADPVAGEPARLVLEGQRVLPQAPAGHALLRARAGDPRRPPAARRALARPCARGQARPARVAGLPDDQLDAARPTSCCRRRPGTRSTTCRRPTCTRSCTRSPRRSTRRGRPARTSTRSTRSPAGSASWPATHLGVRRDLVATPAAARHAG